MIYICRLLRSYKKIKVEDKTSEKDLNLIKNQINSLISKQTGLHSFNPELIEGASYFCGYLAHKLNTYHLKTKNIDIKTCKYCPTILSSGINLNYHQYTTFKDYHFDKKTKLLQ